MHAFDNNATSGPNCWSVQHVSPNGNAAVVAMHFCLGKVKSSALILKKKYCYNFHPSVGSRGDSLGSMQPLSLPWKTLGSFSVPWHKRYPAAGLRWLVAEGCPLLLWPFMFRQCVFKCSENSTEVCVTNKNATGSPGMAMVVCTSMLALMDALLLL